jgi:hypothetical protein
MDPVSANVIPDPTEPANSLRINELPRWIARPSFGEL